MKKLITVSMAIYFLMSTATAALATDYMPFIKISAIPSEKKFALTITNLKENAEISLRDGESGTLLVSDKASARQPFAKIFNLDNLEPGKYYISVKTSMQEIVQPLNLTKYGVEADPNKVRKFYAPIFKVHSNQFVDVSYFAGKLDDVIVTIFDNNGSSVYKERLDNVLLVEKRYDMDTLPWGRYTIQVETEDNVYSKEFDVR
ncbi:MAG: PPC domain-containing protein [Phaeodactylibacter sp.]|uniref:PPC domain-containing protein n=1 Tax=Phaeodactylibacter sp. TaxID=1940289 RepID=UPI0032EED731